MLSWDCNVSLFLDQSFYQFSCSPWQEFFIFTIQLVQSSDQTVYCFGYDQIPAKLIAAPSALAMLCGN